MMEKVFKALEQEDVDLAVQLLKQKTEEMYPDLDTGKGGDLAETPSVPVWTWDCGNSLHIRGAIVSVSSMFWPPVRNANNMWEGVLCVKLLGKTIFGFEYSVSTVEELGNSVTLLMEDIVSSLDAFMRSDKFNPLISASLDKYFKEGVGGVTKAIIHKRTDSVIKVTPELKKERDRIIKAPIREMETLLELGTVLKNVYLNTMEIQVGDIKLDEKGFVFLDHFDNPYWCRVYGGEAWFMYWHDDGKWVTGCRAEKEKVEGAFSLKLTEEKLICTMKNTKKIQVVKPRDSKKANPPYPPPGMKKH
jgi:hypothetical protein